ncbi:MAG: hypothetical protein Q9170_006902, partial [Blastenia crenularia]
MIPQDTPQPGAVQQEEALIGVSTIQRHSREPDQLYPTTSDSTSDNDASERPVREKLKKTSIASIPRNGAASKPPDTTVEQNTAIEVDGPQSGDSPSEQTPSPTSESRGRLSRKRSYDDTIEVEGGAGAVSTKVTHNTPDISHARKRSRDVRAMQSSSLESPTSPIEQGLPEGKRADAKPLSDEAIDEEVEDPTQSPRKKRSREEFDVDAHREQKIPATEEAKAYRRSEDSERDPLQKDDNSVATADSQIRQEQDPIGEKPATLQQIPPLESTVDPPQPAARTSSPQKAPQATQVEPKSSSKPSGGFAASGFAAMSGSSKSPFGTLGASTPSVFRSSSTEKSNDVVADKSIPEPQKIQPSTSAFSNSASPFVTSATTSSRTTGFGFGANGAAPKPSGFGGSVFGSAFTNSAAAAPKLTSFAAPTGDLAPSKPAESNKPFGAQADDSAEEEGASEGEANAEEVGNGDVEVDSRFQHQEVETGEAGERSIFLCPRAQLYYFDSGGWHEKGKGAFKLNVAEDKEENKARFIMRAHQTFRVLLNQPVFKKMQVGDSKGREPQGKNFAFAVIDQGRPTPHLLK